MPVTQKPYTVHVPQNVPVNFVPVSVPTQQLPGIQVVQQDPFTYCEYTFTYCEYTFTYCEYTFTYCEY